MTAPGFSRLILVWAGPIRSRRTKPVPLTSMSSSGSEASGWGSGMPLAWYSPPLMLKIEGGVVGRRRPGVVVDAGDAAGLVPGQGAAGAVPHARPRGDLLDGADAQDDGAGGELDVPLLRPQAEVAAVDVDRAAVEGNVGGRGRVGDVDGVAVADVGPVADHGHAGRGPVPGDVPVTGAVVEFPGLRGGGSGRPPHRGPGQYGRDCPAPGHGALSVIERIAVGRDSMSETVASGSSSGTRGSRAAYLPCRNQTVRSPSLFAGRISLSRQSPIMISSEGGKPAWSRIVRKKRSSGFLTPMLPDTSLWRNQRNTPRSSRTSVMSAGALPASTSVYSLASCSRTAAIPGCT